MKKKILQEYDSKKITYLELEKKIRDLMESLINKEKITIHAIESRVKDRNSLSKKIDKKEDKYIGLNEITDTLGLRIVTYFEDDVDRIAEIIKREFYLDEVNSVDKRDKKYDEFGYSSLHYIIKLKENRSSLPEYSKFNEINFELQIRSILQHAWAEIEHDIGYKNEVEIPKEIRRDLSRISSLLELADIEFIRIKSKIKEYAEEVKENLKIQQLEIPLDQISLREFVSSSNLVIDVDNSIVEIFKCQINKEYNKSLNFELKTLKYLDIQTIGELKSKLEENREGILKIAQFWKKSNGDEDSRDMKISKGISILYLCYYLVTNSRDTNLLNDFANNIVNNKSSSRFIKILNGMANYL